MPVGDDVLGESMESNLEPTVSSYTAAVGSCETGEWWQTALTLWVCLRQVKLEPDAISYISAISTGENAGQWQLAVTSLGE